VAPDAAATDCDDHETDRDSRLILSAVRQSLDPAATWGDIKLGVRTLRVYVEAQKEERR